MLSKETAHTVMTRTLTNGGGTFDRLTGEPVEPTTGYAVGLPGGQKVDGKETNLALLSTAIRRVSRDARAPYLGTWMADTLTGSAVYVDPVVILPDRESAVLLARALGELAIWDFGKGREVHVNEKAA